MTQEYSNPERARQIAEDFAESERSTAAKNAAEDRIKAKQPKARHAND